jgi:hypothetical protein
MKKVALVLLPFLLMPTLVSAQSLFPTWYEMLNIPAQDAEFPRIIYFVFIPFLGTFTIIWGILTNLKIFQINRVNAILSFIFALALLYSTYLTALTFYLFQAGGVFGVIAFFVLFFGLTSLFSARRIGVSYAKTREVFKDIQKEEEKVINKKIKGSKNLTYITKKITELENLQKKVLAELTNVTKDAGNAEDILNSAVNANEETIRRKYRMGKNRYIEQWSIRYRKSQRRAEELTRKERRLETEITKWKERRDKIIATLR